MAHVLRFKLGNPLSVSCPIAAKYVDSVSFINRRLSANGNASYVIVWSQYALYMAMSIEAGLSSNKYVHARPRCEWCWPVTARNGHSNIVILAVEAHNKFGPCVGHLLSHILKKKQDVIYEIAIYWWFRALIEDVYMLKGVPLY